MKTSQIGYFLALCEDLNFTKAAERCGVAQSTLTRAIKLLEMEFGGPLLRRERANTPRIPGPSCSARDKAAA
jgi:DNA-binding transcriptional LysR family regulator